MSDNTRLHEAADFLDWLYEGSSHIPTDLVHDREFRVGLVRTQQEGAHFSEVAQFFWGGAAEVFMTLGPAVLPLLASLLRAADEPRGHGPGHDSLDGAFCCSTGAALALADHILTIKETVS